MTTRGTNRVPNRLHHSSSRDSRRAWDGVPPQPSALLSGGLEIALSGIKIGLTNPGPGIGDDLRLRYRPEAECISFEGPNSRGMLVPLEEMLLKDNMDGTISIFFRRQFRRKYYTLEGSSARSCDHIQAFKNELNLELHMLCFVTGYEPLTSAANFVRKVKQGRQSIPLPQRNPEFPAYTSYSHPQPQTSIPIDPRDFNTPDGHLDEFQQRRRRNSYYQEPEVIERRQSGSGNSSGTEGGPRVRFRDHPPPPVPQPPPMNSHVPLRGGAGPPPGQFREYGYEEQFARDPRDGRSMRNGNIDRSDEKLNRDSRHPRSSRTPIEDRNGFGPPRNSTPAPRDRDPRYSRGQSMANGDWVGTFEQPLPPRNPTPSPRDRDQRYPRSRPTANGDWAGAFELPITPHAPVSQKRMFALVFRKSPVDQSFEIRPASIDSSHEALVRQASNHWNLRDLRLYGHVDGLKMNLNSQVDLEAYLKLCDGMQRLMVDVE